MNNPENSYPIPGQRWLSDSETELGLGIIYEVSAGRVKVYFPAASEFRLYALKTAPLRRVQFAVGDRVRLQDGSEIAVSEVTEEGGLLVYHADKRAFAEAELSDAMSVSTPWDRLLNGRVDKLGAFVLRVAALKWRHTIRSSPVRGFVGARVDRLPHQIYIAQEVASRMLPRVLLADEVGLGKTIEAGLILHRLHLTGRAGRVLILVPEPLVHQWFVEMLRRFNLLFSIFDPERCDAIEAGDPGCNPFLDSQLVLCGLSLLELEEQRALQAVQGEWDLVIVDEAHHLEWHRDDPSHVYRIVEQIAASTPGLLLLTATPQQLGAEGHFARLRLIDPDRYSSLDNFTKEARNYEKVAAAVERLISGKTLVTKDAKIFGDHAPRVQHLIELLEGGEESARAGLISALIDDFGVGRALFRNRRVNMKGFPERKVSLVEIPAGETDSEKMAWLATLLRRLDPSKVLLICRSRELAETLHAQLPHVIQIKSALFHEGLTLINRDRNAAYFAEEDGARILICSEIGSEGRNFQFAHHLVLFDLPEDPDLLEQRIGRLDRIGQSETIHIHVPYQKRTRSEVLVRWLHEGLNAFEKTPHGAFVIASEFAGQLAAAFEEPDKKTVDDLIAATRKRHRELSATLAKGNDRLLDLNSCRPEKSQPTIARILGADADPAFEAFFIGLLDDFGLHVEELAPRKWLFQTGHLRTDAFPALPEVGMSATFDHALALRRDDLDFMTIDHPLVRGAMDLLLGSDSGNAAHAEWHHPGEQALYLEMYSVLECTAPAALHADRFLAPTPIRVVVDHKLSDSSELAALLSAKLVEGELRPLLEKAALKQQLLPSMLEAAEKIVETRTAELVALANQQMDLQLQGEIDRLKDLQTLNDRVRPEEIQQMESQQSALRSAIEGARPRVDAIRLIVRKSSSSRSV